MDPSSKYSFQETWSLEKKKQETPVSATEMMLKQEIPFSAKEMMLKQLFIDFFISLQ